MRNRIHLTVLAGSLFAASVGCVSAPRSENTAHPHFATFVSPTPVQPAADEPTEATLVVRREIVNVCPPLTELRARLAVLPPDAIWIAILDGLASCMQVGDLRGRGIVLRGAKIGRDLVGYVLAARGISADRVASDPNADTSHGQVEISLGSGAGATR